MDAIFAASEQTSIDFKYHQLWRWFRDDPESILQSTTDMVAYVYQYQPQRTTLQGVARGRVNLDKFLTPNMRAFRVKDGDPLLAEGTGGLGIFVVMEADAFGGDRHEKAIKKKALYVVLPKRHDDQQVVTANHLSFVVNHKPGDRNPLHFHYTTYMSNETGNWSRAAYDNYCPLNFELPTTNFAAFKAAHLKTSLGQMDVPVYRVFRRPYLPQSVPSNTSGGGSKRRVTGRRRAQAATDALPGQPTFEDLWSILPLQRMRVLGVKHGAWYHFTVDIRSRIFNTPEDAATPAAVFRLTAAEAMDRRRVEEEVARVLGGLRWQSFMVDDDVM
jgi:hypothetical protein